MAREKGHPREERLADTTFQPQRRRYYPPPLDVCDETTTPVRLPQPGHELRLRYAVYRNLIVDFAVVQIARIDGAWIDVAKIACDQGIIYRYQHVHGVDEEEKSERRALHVIPPDRGWEAVDKWYDDAVQIMDDEWEDNLRRWNSDGAQQGRP